MKSDEYEIMYRVEDAHWWYRGLRAVLQDHLRQFAPAGSVRLLDVGCGTGANLQVAPEPATAFGVDYAFEAVRFCRKRSLRHTLAASALDLPFADASIDVMISCDVLCHRSIRNKRAALGEMRRVLAQGGLLLLNLPAYQWLHSSHDVHVHTDRRFSRGEVAGLLREADFQPLRITYWNAVLFPAAASVRLWRKLAPPQHSDLAQEPGALASACCSALLACERSAMRIADLPFGLSVFAAARKPAV
ncbi:MAG: class I SAM-dependent methyltransferase [Candidatus Hydrogenedentes bacterium]|nr:class I SAM-dependent methyltransferase [Candidatus Hydrogenedentota bacterium]